MFSRAPWFLLALPLVSALAAAGVAETPPKGPDAPAPPPITPEQSAFFEAKIRPILAEKCYACHSQAQGKSKGGLTLDSRAGWAKGGDSGSAIVPFKPEESALLTAIGYQDPDLAMPPAKSGGKLPDAVIADFKKWIQMGAPDPRIEPLAAPAAAWDMAQARKWWSFQPLGVTVAPTVADATWNMQAVDRFIDAALVAKGLHPNPEAEAQTLLRRVTLDLTGLPPTPEEAAAFAAAWKDAAGRETVWAATVDRLLASPRFGERFGRHWLDVARYAESSGRDMNLVYPQAWRYRDYVISAFNGDLRYDQFLREQVAGDLLPAQNDAERARQLVATGFLALGAKSLNETKPKQFTMDVADEQIDTLTQATLGLTVACARCHDHKFDPISQRDYTALAGIFLSTDTKYGTPGGVLGRNMGHLCPLPAGTGQAVAKPMAVEEWKRKQAKLADLTQQQQAALAARRAGGSPSDPKGNGGQGQAPADNLTNFDVARIMTQVSQLQAELANFNADGSPKLLAMGVGEKPVTLPTGRGSGARGRQRTGFETLGDAPLFARGDVDHPGDKVPRGVPELFPFMTRVQVPSDASGRLQLAAWLTAKDNPLTARVMVNRVWQWLFGRGLVASVDNFGTTGSTPSHPALLDALAAQFMQQGWSVKGLVRTVVLSHAYRQSSAFDAAQFNQDPDNVLVWRHGPRRLEAEEIRDSMLFAAGTLDLKPPAGSLIGCSGDGPIGGDRMMVFTEEVLVKSDSNARSIYLPLARNAAPEMLSVFDYPESVSVQGARAATHVPAQSLFMLNSDFAAKQAANVATRVLAAYPGGTAEQSLGERFDLACRLILGRAPKPEEQAAAKSLVAHHAHDPAAAWTAIARGLFATAEFSHVD